MNPELIAFVMVAYLVGSIPIGIIVAKIIGAPDPRTVGSGNIGATNVGRAAGKAAGIITLIGDILKGFLITIFALYFFGKVPTAISVAGLAVFLGHLFPLFLHFKGGKGVATALGIFLAITPLPAALTAVIFATTTVISRYVSLGSIVASASLPVLISLFASALTYIPLAVVVSILIIIKHSDNIKRLVQGTENKIGKKRND